MALGNSAPTHISSDLKAASFEWYPEKKKTLQKIKSVVYVTRPAPWAMRPNGHDGLEISVGDKDGVWSLTRLDRRI